MRIVFLLLLVFGGAVVAPAQIPPADSPITLASPADAENARQVLNVTDAERQYFELGDILAQAAFAYSPLVRQARQISHGGMTQAQMVQIGKLTPDARHARDSARVLFTRAATLMGELNAPAAAVAPIATLTAHLGKPLTPTGAAQQIAILDPDVGTVLAALDESNRLSNILSDKALQNWTTGGESDQTGRVWYAEGLMAGVAQSAALLSQPELLPPMADLATDLRGLRDWLSLRMPEIPTPDQIALQTDITTFMAKMSSSRHRFRTLTLAQVQDLNTISRLVQTQILPADSPMISSNTEAGTTAAPDTHKAPAALPPAPDGTGIGRTPQGLL